MTKREAYRDGHATGRTIGLYAESKSAAGTQVQRIPEPDQHPAAYWAGVAAGIKAGVKARLAGRKS